MCRHFIFLLKIDARIVFDVKAFSTSVNLKRHVHVIHLGNKDYKCKSCGRLFTRSENLKKHLLVHTALLGAPDTNKIHKCDPCTWHIILTCQTIRKSFL